MLSERVVRCPGCYLPMHWDLPRDWWTCWCTTEKVTEAHLFDRAKWRRLLDRLTGMVEGC